MKNWKVPRMYREEECLSVARAKETGLGIDICDLRRAVGMSERFAVGAFRSRPGPALRERTQYPSAIFCHTSGHTNATMQCTCHTHSTFMEWLLVYTVNLNFGVWKGFGHVDFLHVFRANDLLTTRFFCKVAVSAPCF